MTESTQTPFTDVPPNAPGYREFRMMAEWASAIRDEPLYFPYSDLTGRIGVTLATGVEPPVETPPDERGRPRVRDVRFTVTREGSECSLTLTADQCSALFWSESSVEKFLFPSLASASADDAARFLGRLSDAWYGYPGRVVEVCALAYGYGSQVPEGPVSLDAAVGLVCLERASPKLKLMTLDEFERTYPTGAARGFRAPGGAGTEVEKLAGWPTHEADSIVVREVAEFVSGLRGHYVRFTFDGSELVPWVFPTESPGTLPEEWDALKVSEGVTVAVRPDRPYPSHVSVRLEGVTEAYSIVPLEPPRAAAIVLEPDPIRDPDSVFWTDGAVEKLLLPYYASVKGRHAPEFITLLMGKWDGSIHPAHPAATLAELIPAALLADDDSPPEVYAITHLPRSEYIDGYTGGGAANGGEVAHSPALEHRTALLTLDRLGGFGVESLAGRHPEG